MIRAQLIPAALLTLVFTALTGVIFPIVIWGISQITFPYQANGSLLRSADHNIGSELIGQKFESPRYFHSRPSAAGSGYDPTSSGGTNLGPTSKKLFAGQPDDSSTTEVDESFVGIEQLAQAYRKENGLPIDILLPPDAVTRSASGLDPHISPKNANLQLDRIAKERGINKQELELLIAKVTEIRFLGLFGEPRINVLKLNLALDDLLRNHGEPHK